MNDKFRVVDFHQMAGFNDGFQVAVEQLRFKGIVRVGLIAQAADVIRHVVRAAKQGDDLVHGVHAETVEGAILRQSGLGFRHRAVVIEVAFDFHDLAEFAAFNRLFRRQEAAVKATVLVRRDGQPFAFRQREQLLRFGEGRGERFFHQHVFTRFQRAFRVVKVAVGVGTDHHQLHLRVVKHLIKIAGEMNMGILRRLLFWLRAAAIDMGHVPGLFTVENIRKVVTRGAFAKSNKCAV